MATLEPQWKDRITINPRIHFGKSCVAGTRIPVRNVLELVREGILFEQIVRDYYPDLKIAEIQACIEYAMAVDSQSQLRG